MKAIIVDDVEAVAQSLKKLIEKYCDGIEIIGVAESANEAKIMIDESKPDLVFLDIQMPGKSGFDLLKEFDKIDFSVVFVTAYDQYAVKALRFGALDYLIKPVDIEELKFAIEKAKVKTEEKNAEIKNLIDNILNPTERTMILNTKKGFKLIYIDSILRIEADGNYSYIYDDEGKRFVSTKNLKVFENYLESFNFLRIHNSHIVNTEKIKDINTHENLEVVMVNGITLPIATRKKQVLIKLYNRF